MRKHGSLSYQSLGAMQYLDKCLNETMRKYPTGTSVQRSCAKSYFIPDQNVTIPKGQSVLIPVYAIHWDKNIYPQPEVFDPERFSSEKIAARHQMAFMPFGGGPRQCVGRRLVMLILKIAMAKFLSNYNFALDTSRTSNPLKLAPSAVVITPLESIFIQMKKRLLIDDDEDKLNNI